MSTWTFSQSSLPCLENCIAAAPPDPNNKWFQKFGKKESPVDLELNPVENLRAIETDAKMVEMEATANYDDFFDTIQSETIFPADYVIKECTKNPELITKLAENISTHAVGQLFKSIFNDNKESEFLCTFITKFMPIFIKLQYSRECIDLLVRLHDYPDILKQLLQILINDTEIPNQVLINYTAALNEMSATDFVNILSGIDITSEGFSHNVLAIYTAYKDSAKTDFIQNFVQKLIMEHSKNCAVDRNFGRLFLTFLQNEKVLERNVNMQEIEECLELHRSPFKRPCSMLLKEINLN